MKGKTIARLSVLFGLVVLVASSLLFRREIVEYWHSRRLYSADAAERDAALAALIEMGSTKIGHHFLWILKTEEDLRPWVLQSVYVPSRDEASRRVVEAVSPDDRLTVLSVGEDGGMREGKAVLVFRSGEYIGRAVIQKVYADLSGAKILSTRDGYKFEVGDQIATDVRRDLFTAESLRDARALVLEAVGGDDPAVRNWVLESIGALGEDAAFLVEDLENLAGDEAADSGLERDIRWTIESLRKSRDGSP